MQQRRHQRQQRQRRAQQVRTLGQREPKRVSRRGPELREPEREWRR